MILKLADGTVSFAKPADIVVTVEDRKDGSNILMESAGMLGGCADNTAITSEGVLLRLDQGYMKCINEANVVTTTKDRNDASAFIVRMREAENYGEVEHWIEFLHKNVDGCYDLLSTATDHRLRC